MWTNQKKSETTVQNNVNNTSSNPLNRYAVGHLHGEMVRERNDTEGQ